MLPFTNPAGFIYVSLASVTEAFLADQAIDIGAREEVQWMAHRLRDTDARWIRMHKTPLRVTYSADADRFMYVSVSAILIALLADPCINNKTSARAALSLVHYANMMDFVWLQAHPGERLPLPLAGGVVAGPTIEELKSVLYPPPEPPEPPAPVEPGSLGPRVAPVALPKPPEPPEPPELPAPVEAPDPLTTLFTWRDV